MWEWGVGGDPYRPCGRPEPAAHPNRKPLLFSGNRHSSGRPKKKRFIWPPPAILLVRVPRGGVHGTKRTARVIVPDGTFPVDNLFAEPNTAGDPTKPRWNPQRAYYRAAGNRVLSMIRI